MSSKETPKESPAKERGRRRRAAVKAEKSETPSKAATNTVTTPSPAAIASPESKKPRTTDVVDRAKQAKTVFFYEENAVENREPKTDLMLHKQASDELRKVMSEIVHLKSSGDEDKAGKLEELRIHGTLQFVTLRKLNRMAHFRCKRAKDRTSDAKQQIDQVLGCGLVTLAYPEIDQQNLRLQNLLYEVMHLQKEITKCLEFKSKDEDITLVPVDDFYTDAPPAVSRSEVTRQDQHQQTLARLEWELQQRKRLSEKLTEAEERREVISKEMMDKRDYLDSLQPKLNTILQATKPVQDYLEMPFDEVREQQMTAMYLPQPLYVLYMQSAAYSDACDKYMTVGIRGDVDVAKAMEDTTLDLDDDSDSDNEEQEKPREKRRRRMTTGDDHIAEKKHKILKKHPLSINICIKCKDGSTLDLVFSYLVVLKIVTVEAKLTPSSTRSNTSVSGSELLQPDSLLNCLYPDDTGSDTPNSANNFALRRVGLGEFSQYVREVGRPYHWAQWLCGLQFLHTSDKSPRVQVSLSHIHMEGTIKRLRRRIKARQSLQKQLGGLERGQVIVSPEYHDLFPAKISARLTSWKQSIYNDFVAAPYTQHLTTAELVPESALFFVGVAERGSARMTMQVVVSHDYPEVAPLFALSVSWKRELTSTNNENIRSMEAEVNIHHDELVSPKSHDQLLTNQVERLLMCLDVFLESEPDGERQEGPPEFSREKIFPRLTRGLDRVKPYKFNPQLRFFSQR